MTAMLIFVLIIMHFNLTDFFPFQGACGWRRSVSKLNPVSAKMFISTHFVDEIQYCAY